MHYGNGTSSQWKPQSVQMSKLTGFSSLNKTANKRTKMVAVDLDMVYLRV